MLQPDHAEPGAHGAEHASDHAEGGFDAGQVIIDHVTNSSPDHPILHLPAIFGIDFSISKHVFMLLFVATVVLPAPPFWATMVMTSGSVMLLILVGFRAWFE